MKKYDDMDFEKGMSLIKDSFKKKSKRCEELARKLREYNEQEEIQNLKYNLEKAYRNSLINMSDLETNRLNDFIGEHYVKCKNGSHYVYEVIGTEVGAVIKVVCPVCGEKSDITDYSMW